jgi:hypothetical protein
VPTFSVDWLMAETARVQQRRAGTRIALKAYESC